MGVAGGKMAVSCENQLLLLTQPADGPVPEPSVLGAIPPSESLIDDDPGRQVRSRLVRPVHVCLTGQGGEKGSDERLYWYEGWVFSSHYYQSLCCGREGSKRLHPCFFVSLQPEEGHLPKECWASLCKGISQCDPSNQCSYNFVTAQTSALICKQSIQSRTVSALLKLRISIIARH